MRFESLTLQIDRHDCFPVIGRRSYLALFRLVEASSKCTSIPWGHISYLPTTNWCERRCFRRQKTKKAGFAAKIVVLQLSERMLDLQGHTIYCVFTANVGLAIDEKCWANRVYFLTLLFVSARHVVNTIFWT